MPQTKYNCPSCRRLVDIDSPTCPYCSTPNPKFKKPAVQTQKKEADMETADNVGEELFDDFNTEDNSSNAKPQTVSKKAESVKTVHDTASDDEEEYILPTKQVKPATNAKQVQPQPQKSGHSESLSVNNNDREKIAWTDEKKKNADASKENMYSPDGKYNANYDGYYDDILPKISDEVDKILLNKEKTILKIIGAVVIIIGIIVYLVVTLN